MKSLSIATLLFAIIVSGSARTPNKNSSTASAPGAGLLGFRDAAAESAIEARFLAVPDPKLAEEHLRMLTQAPHMAGTIEDKATADYVAQKFREAGLDTEIVEYKVWINYPSGNQRRSHRARRSRNARPHPRACRWRSLSRTIPRVVMPFNGMSPSGDVEADVVYANYGTPDDFEKLEKMKIDVRGKIVLVRYGQNFRGVKVFVAQEHGAAGVIIYSDPADDGWRRGDKYPDGPWRPDTGVQRGSHRIHVRISRRSHHAGRRVSSVSSRIATHLARTSPQTPKIPVRRSLITTPGRYPSIWPVLNLRAIGKARCHSPITSVPARYE